MTYRTGTALVLTAAMVVAACSTGASGGSADNPIPATSSTVPSAAEENAPTPREGDEPIVNEPLPTTPPVSTDRSYEGDGYPTELTGMVTGAVGDLAECLSVDSASIVVGTVEEVVWPNGGLGCPQPGMVYAQVLTDGLRIVLIHDGTEYVYHSGGMVEPFLCLPESAKDSSGSVSELGESAEADSDESATDGTLQTEKTVPSDESVPTEQPGGPDGEPDV